LFVLLFKLFGKLLFRTRKLKFRLLEKRSITFCELGIVAVSYYLEGFAEALEPN